jgi:hypothetical protein
MENVLAWFSVLPEDINCRAENSGKFSPENAIL